MLGLLAILGCGGGDADGDAVRPTLGLAVPLSGQNRALGEAAVRAAELAANGAVAILPVDDAVPGAAAALAGRPEVFGVVAHVVRGTAERQASTWLTVDVPTIVAAAGDHTGVPRVVPPVEETAKCAARLIDDAWYWVRTDSTVPAMRAGKAFVAERPDDWLGSETVDAGRVAAAASKVTGRKNHPVVWAGSATEGGNLLRALRNLDNQAPFVALGAYDPDFLASAGAAAEGALVTSEGRPARERAFVDAWTAKHGAAPPEAAVGVYDAATLLLAAWQNAAADTSAGPPTASGPSRDAVRRALGSAVATGASGTMYLDAQGVVRPVVCASFRVTGGAFVLEGLASETDALVVEEEPAKRRPREPESVTLRPPPRP